MRIFPAFLLGVLLLLVGPARSDSDSITLTREQINQLEAQVEDLMQKRERAAFEAGKRSQRESCASLI